MHNYTFLDHNTVVSSLFHPVRINKTKPLPPFSDFDIPVADGVTLGCRLYSSDTTHPTILYFHGNGETVADYDNIAPLYSEAGLNLFVFTYRGYGWSTGTPDVTSMMADCCTCISFAKNILQTHGFTGVPFVMGRSIGSASAIEATLSFDDYFKGIILDSGFSDTLPLLEKLGADVSAMSSEDQGFRNVEKIQKITMPTLIMHGSIDTIIPVAQAEKLQSFSGARTKKFFVIPGADHNSLLVHGKEHYFQTIKSFVDDITGESSWRKRRKRYKKQK